MNALVNKDLADWKTSMFIASTTGNYGKLLGGIDNKTVKGQLISKAFFLETLLPQKTNEIFDKILP